MKRRATQLVIWFVGYLVIGSVSAPKAYALLDCTDQVVPTLPPGITAPTGESHPLRPNPYQVCSPDVPQGARISCGTDMVVVKEVRFQRAPLTGDLDCTPSGGNPGDPIVPGSDVTCTRRNYQVTNVPVSIDLSLLELPIAGVASNTVVSDTTPDFLRMGNYTSWYLQGALEQADQEPVEGRTVPLGSLPVRVNPGGPTPPPPDFSNPVKLLALGDSITKGWYPCKLHDILESDPSTSGKVTFVGGEENDFCPPQLGEGHLGETTSQILNRDPAGLTRTYDPNIVLIHLGTNDAGASPSFDAAVVTENIQDIIDAILTEKPETSVFIAQIIPNNGLFGGYGSRERIEQLNNVIGTTITGAFIVDQFTAIDPNIDLSDAVHPNESGGQKMAQRFMDAMLQAGGAPPAAGPSVTPAVRPMTFDDVMFATGPLKKLIPPEVFSQRKKDIINSATAGKTYNQIIGFVKGNKVIGRKEALALYQTDPGRTDIEKIRLADMTAPERQNPLYDPTNQDAMKWYTLWRQVPFVQPVDLAGEVYATISQADPDVKDATLTFDASLQLQDLRVSFPHLAEDNQLAELLQDVIIPAGVDETTGYQNWDAINNPADPRYNFSDSNISNREPAWNTSYCRPENQLPQWNPGDNLGSTTVVKGKFSFKKDVTYTYREPTVAELAGQPRPKTEDVDVTAPLSVFARTPLALEDMYDRLVNGPGSIYRALNPLAEPTIRDDPGAAGLGGSCGPGCTVRPGNQEGRKFEMFFPHLGSMLLNFHQKIQQILSPLGGSTPGATGGFASSSPYATMDMNAALNTAAIRNNVPRTLLQAIYEIEGTEYAAYGTCVSSVAGAKGPMQIVDAPGSAYWDVADTTERQILNLCNPGDAAEIAARIIVFKVGHPSATDPGDIKRAAKGYYGSCTPDSVTEGRWGTGIGYCDFVVYRMGLCSPLAPSCDGE